MRTVLKKFLSGAVALVIMLNLVGCSNQMDEEQIGQDMEEVLTCLFDAVQERDLETFKTFFDDDVVTISDFEYGCNYVFELYQGDLLNINYFGTGHTGKTFTAEEQICYAYMTFDVITSEKEYRVGVEFYTQYPYKIRKFKLLDKQENVDDYGFSQRYGIFYPGWLNNQSN